LIKDVGGGSVSIRYRLVINTASTSEAHIVNTDVKKQNSAI
jgi:hypothetical protein